jgi:hypothetical protein
MRLALPRLVLVGLLALAPLSARAAGECDDDFAECKDDCLIQYGGSIRVEVKKQYDKCMKKCTKASRRCTERQMETQSNQLDEGALDRTPTSDQVDADGLPTREPPPKQKPDERREPTPRDEQTPPKPALESPKPRETTGPTPTAPKSTEPAPIRMTLKKDDGKSAGDDLRDDGPREAAPNSDEPAKPKRREKEKKSPPKKSVDDDDLRDQ